MALFNELCMHLAIDKPLYLAKDSPVVKFAEKVLPTAMVEMYSDTDSDGSNWEEW